MDKSAPGDFRCEPQDTKSAGEQRAVEEGDDVLSCWAGTAWRAGVAAVRDFPERLGLAGICVVDAVEAGCGR